MGKQRQTALILGEGPTEFFYFKSLCDVFKRLTIKPDYPKHTNIKELDAKIAEGVAMGYSHIFCIKFLFVKVFFAHHKPPYNNFIEFIYKSIV